MKKEAWLVRYEAERARWEASRGGKATMAMHEAAKKAGFGAAMRAVGAEVFVSCREGRWFAHVETSEPYVRERGEEWTAEMAATAARAEGWLKRYAVAKGWEA